MDLFGPPDECSDLAALLDRLGYSARPAGPCGALRPLPGGPAPDAAIVIDHGPDTVAICAGLRDVCPVILASSQTSFGFRLAAARIGVKALLRRPISPVELAEWLGSFTRPNGSGQTSVVIVDDDQFASEINAEILRSAGMAVETVGDPTLALQAIETRRPDLVLMDMQMPEVSGIELAQVIRQSRQFMSMPIVFLSGERNQDRQFEARSFGGDDFISKSIDPERLISFVGLRAGRARLLRSMIERDGLTGLYDHSRFNERLSQELERCRRTGIQLSLVMLDIDRFKAVNDTHGHPVGDAVIRTLANSLTAGLRKIDVIGRYGGEEFAIILLDTDPCATKTVMDRIRRRFGGIPFGPPADPFHVTFSAGIASSLLHETLPSLVAAADQTLYRAKAAGRNMIKIADPAWVPRQEAAARPRASG